MFFFSLYFICNFFSVMLPYFTCPKSCHTFQGTKYKKNHDNLLKNKKVIKSQKMSNKLQIFSLKIHKGVGI